MPLPIPKRNESRKDFITRCMGDPIMVREYKNTDQRLAICSVQFRKK